MRVGTIATTPAGAWMSTLRSGLPVSSRATVTAGSSLSREASTQPAEPAPTIT
ncbi:MAG: hypothetical protein U1F49_11195 [Rubrivivax sp.]